MTYPFIHRLRLQRDLLRRRIAMWLWDGPNQSGDDFAERVVFIRWDAKLGDAIVLSWVLREIKLQRPDLEISVITSPALEPLFRQGYEINSVYLAGKQYGWRQLTQIAKTLNRSRYVVHLSEIWRPRDLRFVRSLNAQRVVGMDDELQIINIKLGRSTQGKHFSGRLVPWLEQLGVDTSNRQYWIPRSPNAAARVAQDWPGAPVVGLCPYGASKKRQLSTVQIRLTASHILSRTNIKLLMIVRPNQEQTIRSALGGEPWFDRVFFQTTEDLFEVCEQVAKCDAVVSVDTAIVHIASGLQKPLLALYALHHNQFDTWRAMSSRAICQFVVMGREAVFNIQESDDLQLGIQQLLNQL